MYGPQSLLLLSGIATNANGDGSWFYVGNLAPSYSVLASGIVAGDEIQIWVSNNNASTPPASFDAAGGAVQLGSTITTASTTEVTGVYSWLAIRKTAFAGGGAIVVRLAALVA